MTDLFLTILNMSLSASWLVAAVVILRLLLKKAPRWIHVVLWGFVAFRLVCPFTLESTLSLIPNAEVIPPDIATSPVPVIETGIAAFNRAVNPVIQDSFAPAYGDSVNPLQVWSFLASCFWAAGAVLMGAYALFSYWRLRRRVRLAIRVKENIFLSEYVDSPFVLGIFKPRIYLPYHMPELDRYHVLAHERTHIRRKDHWWKPLGYLLLAIHWFNPLMWLAYILLCRDIELACDEKVIQELGHQQRADYSQALLNCSAHRKLITACPVAFGEVGVKARVKNVLSYKKPAFWFIVLAVIVCIAVAVCFLTDPKPALPFAKKTTPITYAVALDDDHPDTTGMLELNGEELSCLSQLLTELDSIEDYTGTEVDDYRYRYYLRIEPEGCDLVQVYVFNWDTGPVVLEYQNRLYEIKDNAFTEFLLDLYNRGFIVPALGQDCGVTMEVSEASSTGMTIYIHEAEVMEGLLLDSNSFRLQRYDNGAWFDVKDLPDSAGYRINCKVIHADPGLHQLSWVNRCGELPGGNYRLLNDYIVISDENPVRYTVSADFTIPEADTWSFTMTAQTATPTGVTVKFHQDEPVIGRYLYGSDYALEVLFDGNWIPVEQLPQEHAIAWTTEGYDPNVATSQYIGWEWLYGELSPGSYRISKSVTDSQSSENESITLYAEFQIIDPHVITATLKPEDVKWVDGTLEGGDWGYFSLNPEQIAELVSILNNLWPEDLLPYEEFRYTARMHMTCKESSIVLCSNDGQVSLGVSVPQNGWGSNVDFLVNNEELRSFMDGLWELEHLLDPLIGPTYAVTEFVYTDPGYEGIYTLGENTPVYAISEDGHLLAKGEIDSDGQWADMGKLGTAYLTDQNFDPHFDPSFDASSIRENISQAWNLHTHNQADTCDVHYSLLQQKNGELYLVYTHPNLGYSNVRWVMKLEPAAGNSQ